MDMTHHQKVDHLITELGQQGVGSYTVAPPLFRLLWPLGFKVPPLLPRIPQAHPTYGLRFRRSVGCDVGYRYVVVVMARRNPRECCGLDNGVGGSISRINLWVSYGLV